MDPGRARRLGLALLALNLLWRTVRWALDFPIWGDEAFVAVNLDARDLAGLFRPLEYGQIAPLGWLWMEDLLRSAFGPSTLALRAPAWIAGCASAVLMHRLCFRLAPGAGGLLGFAIFAASYYPTRHGAELKPYAFDLLFGLLILFAALRLAEGERARRDWTAFAAVLAAGVFLSYPSLFVGAAALSVLGLVLLRERAGARAWAPLLAIGAGWGALSLWMLVAFAAPHAAAASWLTEMAMWTPAFPPLARPWEWPWWLLQAHAGYMSAYPSGGREFGSSATLALILIGLFAWRPPRRALLLGLLLAPLAFNFAAALFEKYPYGGSVRVSIFLAPAFCLLAGCGFAALLARLRAARRGPALACLALAALPVGGIAGDVARPYKLESDRACERFTAELAGALLPGDALAGVTNAAARGAPDWFALGGSGARLRWMLARDLPADREIAWNSASAGGGRLWLFLYVDDNDTRNPAPLGLWSELVAAETARRGPPILRQERPFLEAERVELLLFDAPADRR